MQCGYWTIQGLGYLYFALFGYLLHLIDILGFIAGYCIFKVSY